MQEARFSLSSEVVTVPDPTPGLAVCLSSSFLGFYTHAGFLHGLAEAGLWPEEISGASSGAVVAGLAAAGLDPEQIMEFLVSGAFRWGFIEWDAPLRLVGNFLRLRRPSGLLSGRKAIANIQRLTGDRRIEDCRAPRLSLAVTNLTHARTEIKTAGPLPEYVIASCAVPILFQPQVVEGDIFTDGGAANPSPFAQWSAEPGVRRIIVHTIGGPGPLLRAPTMDVVMARNHWAIEQELFSLRAAAVAAAGQTLDLVATPAGRPGVVITLKKAHACYEAGRASGRTVRPV